MRQAVIIITMSVAIHLLLWVVFASFAERQQPTTRKTTTPTVLQVQVVPAPQPQAKRILETAQEETAPPTEARYLGHTNHQAKLESSKKLAKLESKSAVGNARLLARSLQSNARGTAEQKTRAKPHHQQRSAAAGKFIPQKGIAAPRPRKDVAPKLTYAQFLQESQHSLAASIYQDFIPDSLTRGDVIDISTSEYRYIGYFSSLRKAIELAWNYPTQAVRHGQQGIVRLRFAIAADGTASKIKVMQSSGHRMLDVAIVDAIRLASPFSPLPKGLKREQLTITGSFHYILRGI